MRKSTPSRARRIDVEEALKITDVKRGEAMAPTHHSAASLERALGRAMRFACPTIRLMELMS
jgi:hypothetical protein